MTAGGGIAQGHANAGVFKDFRARHVSPARKAACAARPNLKY